MLGSLGAFNYRDEEVRLAFKRRRTIYRSTPLKLAQSSLNKYPPSRMETCGFFIGSGLVNAHQAWTLADPLLALKAQLPGTGGG